MRTRVLMCMALAAAFAAYAIDQTTAAHSEYVDYVVWVDQLNLRAGPSTEAEIITVLRRGDELTYLGEDVEEAGDVWWRRVRPGENEGWVNDWYTLPRAYYDAFRKADELGKAGEAEGMVAAAIEGGRKIGLEEGWGDFYDVSPDRKKIILQGDWSTSDELDWGGNYPRRGRVFSPFPVLLFASGQGLVDYFRSYEEVPGTWSPDSSYYAYVERPIVEYNYTATLKLLDTTLWKRITVGRMICSPELHDYEYEFAGGYLLWADEEPVEEPGPPLLERESATPVLFAYELGTGRKLKLLEADLETLQDEETRVEGWSGVKFYGVKMVAADPCPRAVERSKLYIKYFENYGYAVNRDHYLE